jgi:alcohol oxidase
MKHTSVLVTTGKELQIYHIVLDSLRRTREIHGFEGPIKVSFGNYTYPVMQDFLRAAESQGIPTTDDLQDLVTGQ